LGLTLAKRIVEGYHGGKIFVKNSEVGKGTTFRIMLLGNLEDASQFITEGILEY
jgi:signal transduction histidine kinase